jgi:hypothetical protein
MTSLERLAWSPHVSAEDSARLRELVQNLRADPALDVIEQLTVLDLAAAEPDSFTPEEMDELERLFTAGSPEQRLGETAANLADVSWAAARRWHEVSAGPHSPVRREAARVARRAYASLWEATRQRPDTQEEEAAS